MPHAPDTQRALLVRRLGAADRNAIAGHFAGLDHSSRYHRFGRITTAANVQAYVASIDLTAIVAAGLFDDERLVGLAEIHPYANHVERTAEVALSIATPYQGQGAGKTLLREAIFAAHALGLTQLVFTYTSGNRRMEHVLQALERGQDTRLRALASAVQVHWDMASTCLPQLMADACERVAVVVLKT
jgi:RimJ/RimL family protein N-acetyltransferase